MSKSIRPGEGFTVEQILNEKGFVLDTGEFTDLMEEEDDDIDNLEYKRGIQLSNEEIMRYLSLKDDTENREENEDENVPFVGISFDTIKPKMHSIYGDGEVLKLVKQEGSGEVVPSDAQVTVQYVGYFENQGEPFDSTYYRRDKNIVLRLGKCSILEGLEIAISSMKKHEKALFLIQPRLAYGALGCLPRIPPNAEVLFKVDLINFLDNGQADAYDQLTNEEKKKYPSIEKIVKDLLNTARNSFEREKYKQAIREYNRAVNYLETAQLENDEEEKDMNKLLSRALTNLTICYNKLSKPRLACSAFHKLPTKSGKAIFQYGKALKCLGEYDEAMKELQRAYTLVPGCQEILTEIKEVEDYRKKHLEQEKRFAQSSLKLRENPESCEFEQTAIEMCDHLLNDPSLVKEEIPQGLSLQEEKCLRRVAATRGLLITKLNRRGIESLYLTKKNYIEDPMR